MRSKDPPHTLTNSPTIENLKYIAGVYDLINTSTDVTREDPKDQDESVINAWRIKGFIKAGNEKTKKIEVIVLEDYRHNKYYTFDARTKEQKKSLRTTSVNGRELRVKANNSTFSDNITHFELNVKIIPTENEFIRLENDNSIEWYIRKGYLTYKDGVFTSVRKIPNKIAKELEKFKSFRFQGFHFFKYPLSSFRA